MQKLLKKYVRIIYFYRIPFSPQLTTVLSNSSKFANLWKPRRETMPLWMEASFDDTSLAPSPYPILSLSRLSPPPPPTSLFTSALGVGN